MAALRPPASLGFEWPRIGLRPHYAMMGRFASHFRYLTHFRNLVNFPYICIYTQSYNIIFVIYQIEISWSNKLKYFLVHVVRLFLKRSLVYQAFSRFILSRYLYRFKFNDPWDPIYRNIESVDRLLLGENNADFQNSSI